MVPPSRAPRGPPIMKPNAPPSSFPHQAISLLSLYRYRQIVAEGYHGELPGRSHQDLCLAQSNELFGGRRVNRHGIVKICLGRSHFYRDCKALDHLIGSSSNHMASDDFPL